MHQQIEEKTSWRFQPKRDDPRWILGCGVGDKKTRAVIYGLVARFIRGVTLSNSAQKKLDSVFLLVGRGGEADSRIFNNLHFENLNVPSFYVSLNAARAARLPVCNCFLQPIHS